MALELGTGADDVAIGGWRRVFLALELTGEGYLCTGGSRLKHGAGRSTLLEVACACCGSGQGIYGLCWLESVHYGVMLSEERFHHADLACQHSSFFLNET